MKLLFDQNLSPRLPHVLEDLYPDSLHVREADLQDATDSEIWAYAKQHRFVIVSKDSGLSATQPSFWSSPKVHLAARRQLPGQND